MPNTENHLFLYLDYHHVLPEGRCDKHREMTKFLERLDERGLKIRRTLLSHGFPIQRVDSERISDDGVDSSLERERLAGHAS